MFESTAEIFHAQKYMKKRYQKTVMLIANGNVCNNRFAQFQSNVRTFENVSREQRKKVKTKKELQACTLSCVCTFKPETYYIKNK